LKRAIGIGVAVAAGLAVALLWGQLPAIGAGGLLHPARRAVTTSPPEGCTSAEFAGAGVTLRGWTCTPRSDVHGTIVYLHGIADNRESAAGVIGRFLPRGLRIVAYDSRAHGASDGAACTYGFYEKDDLRHAIDALPPGPVALIGTSLGAAVALQEAADDPRVTAVVAAETFSDLRTVATERAPAFFTRGTIDRAFALAEAEAAFRVDDVSPVRAASRITAPVLLIHGAADVDTPPAHSERVRAALRGPSELLLVPGAHHNESLNGAEIWKTIQNWIERAIERRV
jgi:pimeloyl-ACP methyl ester carboxylesterase